MYWLLVVVVAHACTSGDGDLLRLQWTGNKPTALDVHQRSIDTSDPDSVRTHLHVRISGSAENLFVLGSTTPESNFFRFTPIVPFTRGQTYDVIWRSTTLGQITIPNDTSGVQSSVVAIYPSSDTIPENSLKMYVEFSQPMTEGRALSFITVIKNARDTMAGTFLDLQPELWNDERTILTLWIDPGRVKTGLIPNREMGVPLERGHHYTVNINSRWKDVNGRSMTRAFSKSFFISERDNTRPSTSTWTIAAPAQGTMDELRVNFHDTLDKWQVEREIRIMDYSEKTIEGDLHTTKEETGMIFTPLQSWQAGTYRITVPGTLEDVAGNNFNRLFDTDLKADVSASEEKKFTVEFVIR